MPAENLALLAIAAAREGESGLAGSALTLAAGRGWRDRVTQKTVAAQAILEGKWNIAFNRTIALWSMGERGSDTITALRRIETTTQGREAAAHWLRKTSRWRDYYIGWSAANLDSAASAAIIREIVLGGVPIDCRVLRNAARHMLARGNPKGALGIWSGQCGNAAASPNDFAFGKSGADDGTGLFDWKYLEEVSLIAIEGSDAFAIAYDNRDPARKLLAYRYALLKPGRYALSAKSDSPNGAIALPLIVRMSCNADGGQPAKSEVILVEGATITVPSRGCAVQTIGVIALRGAGTINALRILPLP